MGCASSQPGFNFEDLACGAPIDAVSVSTVVNPRRVRSHSKKVGPHSGPSSSGVKAAKDDKNSELVKELVQTKARAEQLMRAMEAQEVTLTAHAKDKAQAELRARTLQEQLEQSISRTTILEQELEQAEAASQQATELLKESESARAAAIAKVTDMALHVEELTMASTSTEVELQKWRWECKRIEEKLKQADENAAKLDLEKKELSATLARVRKERDQQLRRAIKLTEAMAQLDIVVSSITPMLPPSPGKDAPADAGTDGKDALGEASIASPSRQPLGSPLSVQSQNKKLQSKAKRAPDLANLRRQGSLEAKPPAAPQQGTSTKDPRLEAVRQSAAAAQALLRNSLAELRMQTAQVTASSTSPLSAGTPQPSASSCDRTSPMATIVSAGEASSLSLADDAMGPSFTSTPSVSGPPANLNGVFAAVGREVRASPASGPAGGGPSTPLTAVGVRQVAPGNRLPVAPTASITRTAGPGSAPVPGASEGPRKRSSTGSGIGSWGGVGAADLSGVMGTAAAGSKRSSHCEEKEKLVESAGPTGLHATAVM